MAPSFYNGTCNPFQPRDAPCALGSLASYSIDVTHAADIEAGVRLARAKRTFGL
jgi:hypothetical protein